MSEIDLEKYRRHVAHFDLPEAQETELLRAVWRIMQSFVDRAFGDDPVQRCLADRASGETKDETDGKDVIELTSIKNDDSTNNLSDDFERNSANLDIGKD